MIKTFEFKLQFDCWVPTIKATARRDEESDIEIESLEIEALRIRIPGSDRSEYMSLTSKDLDGWLLWAMENFPLATKTKALISWAFDRPEDLPAIPKTPDRVTVTFSAVPVVPTVTPGDWHQHAETLVDSAKAATADDAVG